MEISFECLALQYLKNSTNFPFPRKKKDAVSGSVVLITISELPKNRKRTDSAKALQFKGKVMRGYK